MDNILLDVLFAFSQTPPEGGQGGSPWFQCLFPLAFLGIFYALLIRPQQQQQKKHKKIVSELKNGTRVVAGGMVGTIISVKKETIILRTGESKLEMLRGSVEKVLTDDDDLKD